MKLLLDENLPRQLIRDFEAHHEVFTAQEMGWHGIEIGELLVLLLENGFDVLLTGDKNLQHQQNFNLYPIPVLVLNSTFITYPHLRPLVPKILALLKKGLLPGPTLVQE